ncbi:MAG: hypothetical protein SFU27_08185 [Thermonemataceae bacterium]|nr:hypothetical protein [Thermonemataceae bacterium]
MLFYSSSYAQVTQPSPQGFPDKSYVEWIDNSTSFPQRIIFDAQNNSIQTAVASRMNISYAYPLTLNPLGGDVKIVNKLMATGGIQMYNPTIPSNYNKFEILFDNTNNVEGGDNKVIFRNHKKYGGSFLWQNLDDNNNALDLMKLDNNGKLRIPELYASKATIKLNFWQDKVFDNTYKLRSLKEVEKFIKNNKHLPDVPSEKEIIENGLNIGDMQATQMLKIEEITLYLIEQNNIIQKLQEENKVLLKRLEKLEKSGNKIKR